MVARGPAGERGWVGGPERRSLGGGLGGGPRVLRTRFQGVFPARLHETASLGSYRGLAS
jgi:hypothetical protein